MSKKDKTTPKWLRTIQLNSWEAELLVSALVLYALFQIPDFVRQYSLQNIPRGSQLLGLFNISIRAIEILRVGYILHILVRGIWVSSVGLSYVFPQGIKENSLKFKGKFKSELESSNSLIESVLKLEKLSSVIYGISFLIFGSLLGFGVLIFVFIFLGSVVPQYLLADFSTLIILPFTLITVVYFFSLILLFIDFLSNGYFRRKNWTAKWFYPLSKVFRILSLSFLYRRSLLVIISNMEGWKRRAIPFAILIFVAFFMFISKQVANSKKSSYLVKNQYANNAKANYENQRDKRDFLLSTIQSDLVDDNTLRLYVRDISVFGSFYESQLQSSPNLKRLEWSALSADSTSILLNKWLSIQLDSNKISNTHWFITQHTKNYAYGFVSYLNISDLSQGPHTLAVSIDSLNLNDSAKEVLQESSYNYKYLSNIHFIYDK